jgi:hypothetical protein
MKIQEISRVSSIDTASKVKAHIEEEEADDEERPPKDSPREQNKNGEQGEESWYAIRISLSLLFVATIVIAIVFSLTTTQVLCLVTV